MLNHNTSLYKHKISIPILAEISNLAPNKLRKIYRQLIENDCIPLSEIPLHQQETFVNDYLLRGKTLDFDLMKLAAKPDFENPFPFLYSAGVQELFTTTKMIREANAVIDAFTSSKNVTRKLQQLAAQYGISYRTLIRRRNYFMNHNILMQLLEDPASSEDTRDRYPTCCFYARDYIIYRHWAVGRPSSAKILREMEDLRNFSCIQCPYHPDVKKGPHKKGDLIPTATCKRNRETMVIPNLPDTVCTIVNRSSDQETCLAWNGVRAWASKHNYTPPRNKPQEVNYVWIADHTKLDIFVKTTQNPDGTWNSKRVWLTGIIDAATNALVGYALTLQPNSTTIAEAFARACAFKVDCRYCGQPVYYYQDNGRDFCADKLKGLPNTEKEPLYLNKAFGESGLLEWMGIRVIRALPYRGCSKTIERVWGTIEREWISDLPGYCGENPSKRPITLEADRKNGRLYTFTQFAEYFADVIYPEYNDFSETNESTNQLYDRLPKANTLVPTWRTLAVLRSISEERYVHRQGIFFQNQKYWCSSLAPFVETGKTVRVFAFDAPFNRTLVVTLGKITLGEAHLIKNLDLVEKLRYKVIQHVMEQHEHLKVCSKHIELVHNLVLQTNILSEALKLPAIDTYEDHPAFVQTIDFEKDKTDAIDDPRIPEDIKELATNYMDNLLKSDDDNDQPGAATQFFQSLAGPIV